MRTEGKVADRLKRLVFGLVAGLTLAVPAVPAAADYVITDLGTVAGTVSHPFAINNAGQVVGRSYASTGASRAFLWQGDTMVDLNSLIPANSGWVLEVATAINQSGHIVGLGTLVGSQRAFLWRDGQVTDLGTLGGTFSQALGINDVGQVVGCSAIANSAARHAFLWQNGTMTDLNSLIPTDSGWALECAAAINDAGQIVGSGRHGFQRAFLWQDGQVSDLGTGRHWNGESDARSINNVGQVVGSAIEYIFYDPEQIGDPMIIEARRAFLWQSGTIGDLGFLGSSWSSGAVASAINDSGHVVGASFDLGDPSTLRAFLWTSVGRLVDLNNLIPPNDGWQLVDAVAINQAGQIVGTGFHNGQARAFLLTPPPNPPDVAAPTLSLSTGKVFAGSTLTGTVTLLVPAPAGGAVVNLSSSNTSVATVPSSVTVAAGATSATFTVSTNTVLPSSQIAISISASAGGALASQTLLVVLPEATLSSLTLNPASMAGGSAGVGTVFLDKAAPAGGAAVALSSSNPSVVTVPASVTVPAGATSANFSVSTNAVSAATTVTISAAYGGATRSMLVNVVPVALSSLSLNPASLSSGSTSTGTVTLNLPAPAGGAAVSLASSAPAVASIPAAVTVAAGALTATFSVMTVACTSGSATVSGSYGGMTKSAGLNVISNADNVAIEEATYFASKRELRVNAHSTAPSATLRVYVTSSGALIGTMRNLGYGNYSGRFAWPVNPANITVRSSNCGTASTGVMKK